MTDRNAIISADELLRIMNDPGVRIVDASYNLPDLPVRIGRAVDFDIDDIANKDSRFLHTMPSEEIFAEKVGELGISNADHVVVYDRDGMAMAAARVWWMFRAFGHDRVQILDGGLPAWVAKEYPLTPQDEIAPPKTAVYKATFRPELLKRRDDMIANLTSGDFTVIDARDERRYSGEAAEPRPGMTGGHIPGALSLPYFNLIDPDTGLMKTRPELVAEVGSSRVDLQACKLEYSIVSPK